MVHLRIYRRVVVAALWWIVQLPNLGRFWLTDPNGCDIQDSRRSDTQRRSAVSRWLFWVRRMSHVSSLRLTPPKLACEGDCDALTLVLAELDNRITKRALELKGLVTRLHRAASSKGRAAECAVSSCIG